MSWRKFIDTIFFGNFFYGLCAVGLAIEATLQQRYELNSPLLYLGIFALTTWYYSLPYLACSTECVDSRSTWYGQHQRFVKLNQKVLFVICAALLIFFVARYFGNILSMTWTQVALMLIFPLIALLYYGVNLKPVEKLNLRRVGWMKPLVVGFSWAGLTTIFPVIVQHIMSGSAGDINWVGWLLFLKNFLFVTLLAVMFDVKDYAADYHQKLKTMVVKNGLRKTIFLFLIPATIIGLIAFIVFGLARQFSMIRIALNMVPFLFVLAIAFSLQRRKSLLYYLTFIDGAMMVKAICGTIAISFF